MISKEKLKQMEDEEHKKYHRRIAYVIVIILILLSIGTLFYHRVEGWRYLDSLYFSSYTITTVGYGDFVPKTDIGKIFTIIYIFTGVAIVLYGLSLMASHFVEVREEFWLERLGNIRIKHHTKTFWDKLKDFFNFKSGMLVKGYEKSLRKK